MFSSLVTFPPFFCSRPASEYSSPGRPLSCIVDENTPVSTNGATPTTALPPSSGDQRAQERRVRSQRHRNYMSRTHLHTPPDLPEGYGQWGSAFIFPDTKAVLSCSFSALSNMNREMYVYCCWTLGFSILWLIRLYLHSGLCQHCNAVVLMTSTLPSSLLKTGLSNPANLWPHSVQPCSDAAALHKEPEILAPFSTI